ncbi:MAG: twin-arginine translocase TatA/TatE family subunit [Treponema sp.]|nr:twin-arginine translocase TatA/TatE family subunit [Treponema sp.]
MDKIFFVEVRMIGTHELIIVAFVVLVLFGATAIPKFARSLGQAKREFEEGVKDGSKEGKTETKKEKGTAPGGGPDT